MRLDNAVTLFLSEWPAEGISSATVRDYRACLEWLTSFALQRGASALDDLTPSLVRAAALAKMDPSRPRSASFKGGEAAAAQMVAAARKLASWLLAEGLPVADLSAVKAPRVPERVQPRLMDGEFERLQSTILRRLISGGRRVPRLAVARDLALLNLLAETGLRAQEVCGLEVEHVDLNRGELRIARGKGKRERFLPIVGTEEDDDPLRLVRLLDDWLVARETIRRAGQHRRVWVSLKGNPLSTDQLRAVLAKICIEAGLESNRPPHAFRRFVFTEHYRRRPGSLTRLSARMGWSPKSHRMQDVYTRGAELDFAREPMPFLNNRPESTVLNSRVRPILLQPTRERVEEQRRRPAPSVKGRTGTPPPTETRERAGT